MKLIAMTATMVSIYLSPLRNGCYSLEIRFVQILRDK